MAERGPETLRYGPMKPVGLTDPRTGVRPHAVVQLRQDNALGTLFNMVGFQTKLTYGEQKRIFRTIPGLEGAEFARLGGLHRNTFINSPRLLDRELALRARPNVRFAGQITGVEGYVESAAIGLLAGRFAAARAAGRTPAPPPATTALGGLLRHITGDASAATFQPMNVNFGLLPPLEPTGQARRAQAGAWRAARSPISTAGSRRWRRRLRAGADRPSAAVRNPRLDRSVSRKIGQQHRGGALHEQELAALPGRHLGLLRRPQSRRRGHPRRHRERAATCAAGRDHRLLARCGGHQEAPQGGARGAGAQAVARRGPARGPAARPFDPGRRRHPVRRRGAEFPARGDAGARAPRAGHGLRGECRPAARSCGAGSGARGACPGRGGQRARARRAPDPRGDRRACRHRGHGRSGPAAEAGAGAGGRAQARRPGHQEAAGRHVGARARRRRPRDQRAHLSPAAGRRRGLHGRPLRRRHRVRAHGAEHAATPSSATRWPRRCCGRRARPCSRAPIPPGRC